MSNKINVRSIIAAVVGAVIFILALNLSPGPQSIAYSNAVQIPQALVLAINGLLFGLLTAGFVWLFNTVGLNLVDLAAPIAGTLSGFLIGLAQGWIDLQPATSDPWILMVLNVLVVIIAGIPIYVFAFRKLLN